MPPRIQGFRWPPGIEAKVYRKHGLERPEVEESFFYRGSRVRKAGDKYLLYTRTDSGSYILVVYTQSSRIATVISARAMTLAERRMFGRK
jgi:uncharacterized DUF497 family protein